MRKTTLRYRKRVQVRYGIEGETIHTGFSGNISANGMMIQTMRLFRAGTILDIELKLPQRTIALKGRVRWAREGSALMLSTGRIGMGIGFIDPPPDLMRWLTGS